MNWILALLRVLNVISWGAATYVYWSAWRRKTAGLDRYDVLAKTIFILALVHFAAACTGIAIPLGPVTGTIDFVRRLLLFLVYFAISAWLTFVKFTLRKTPS